MSISSSDDGEDDVEEYGTHFTQTIEEAIQQAIENAKAGQFDLYDLDDIKKITKNYTNYVGNSKYTRVYSGRYANLNIAVKRYNMRENDIFTKELEKLVQMNHPSILTILGLCRDDDDGGGLFVLLEYMGRGSLRDYIDDNTGCVKMDNKALMRMLIDISNALSYLHQNNIIHKDLKPSSILFDVYDQPKLAEINLARCYENKDKESSPSLDLVPPTFTDPYWLTTKECGTYCDIYAFGLTMLMVLLGTNDTNVIHTKAKPLLEKNDKEGIQAIFKNRGWKDETIFKLFEMGFNCMKDDIKERPLASDIVYDLFKIADVEFGDIYWFGDIESTESKLKRLEEEFENLQKEIENDKNEHERLRHDYERLKIDFAESKDRKQTVSEEYNSLLEETNFLKETIRHFSKIISENVTTHSFDAATLSPNNLSNEYILLYEIGESDSNVIDESTEAATTRGVTAAEATKESTAEGTEIGTAQVETNVTSQEDSEIARIPLTFETHTKGIFKSYNVEWIKQNMTYVSSICSRIELVNMAEIEIMKQWEVQSEIVLTSEEVVNLRIKDGNNIIIKAGGKLKIDNMTINDGNHGSHSAICSEHDGYCLLNNCKIKNNDSESSIFHLEDGTIELDGVEFEANKSKKLPICFEGKEKSNIILKNCTFRNHDILDEGTNNWSEGASLIYTEGSINITNSTFEKNYIENDNIKSIFTSKKSNSITLTDTKFTTNLPITFHNVENMQIRECNFIENKSPKESNGGAIFIKDSTNVTIERVGMHRNSSENGGAIAFENSTITLKSSNFESNKSSNVGGSIYIKDGGKYEILIARFENNESEGDGLDIYNEDGELKTNEVIFTSTIETKTNIQVYNGDNGSYNGNKENVVKE